MISLPALEEPLARKYPSIDDGARVAEEGTESPRRIVLFTTEDISLEAANDLLTKEGLRGISCVSTTSNASTRFPPWARARSITSPCARCFRQATTIDG